MKRLLIPFFALALCPPAHARWPETLRCVVNAKNAISYLTLDEERGRIRQVWEANGHEKTADAVFTSSSVQWEVYANYPDPSSIAQVRLDRKYGIYWIGNKALNLPMEALGLCSAPKWYHR